MGRRRPCKERGRGRRNANALQEIEAQVEVIYLQEHEAMTNTQFGGLRYGHKDPTVQKPTTFYALPGRFRKCHRRPTKVDEPGLAHVLLGVAVLVALIKCIRWYR